MILIELVYLIFLSRVLTMQYRKSFDYIAILFLTIEHSLLSNDLLLIYQSRI